MTALYICYYPVSEPLVQTQVIAYLRELAKAGHRIVLLTFEPQAPTGEVRMETNQRLAADGITWHWLRYHQRPSLPATIFDALAGVFVGWRLVRRYGVQLIHARSHVPAAMALALKRLLGVKVLFDVRGLLAEEYEDAGLWRRDSVKFRLTKALERRCLAAADAVVVLTERLKQRFVIGGVRAPITVIPCCVDMTAFESPDRATVSSQLTRLRDRTVLIYVGKLGSWYLAEEMAQFFVEARTVLPDLHFLILTQSDHALAVSQLTRQEVPLEAFTVMTVAPTQVPDYLALADVGISFIRPCFSKLASSPTKIGEYLAAGLPVVTNAGIGDCDELFQDGLTGVIVASFDAAGYRDAASRLRDLLSQPEQVRTHSRELARRELSLEHVGAPRYRAVYEALA